MSASADGTHHTLSTCSPCCFPFRLEVLTVDVLLTSLKAAQIEQRHATQFRATPLLLCAQDHPLPALHQSEVQTGRVDSVSQIG